MTPLSHPPASGPTIELVDIYKPFGSTRVLEGVSLPHFPGEVHSLMGENGAGKSTLVKIMAGLHLADKGAVPMDRRYFSAQQPRRNMPVCP